MRTTRHATHRIGDVKTGELRLASDAQLVVATGRFRHDALSERAISAGVLGPDPGVTAFKVQGPVAGLAITDEQSPGSASPSNPVLIQGVVS